MVNAGKYRLPRQALTRAFRFDTSNKGADNMYGLLGPRTAHALGGSLSGNSVPRVALDERSTSATRFSLCQGDKAARFVF